LYSVDSTASPQLQDTEDTSNESTVHLELLVITGIRLDIHFYYKINPVLCIVV